MQTNTHAATTQIRCWGNSPQGNYLLTSSAGSCRVTLCLHMHAPNTHCARLFFVKAHECKSTHGERMTHLVPEEGCALDVQLEHAA
jgi:hypothetical protein